MEFSFAWLCLILIFIINLLFFLSSFKQNWETLMGSSFECGFTSYFFSHFSFSIHYFIVALIFLFLDLELCFIMPFLNESLSDFSLNWYLFLFVLSLFLGLLYEWKEGKLEWIF